MAEKKQPESRIKHDCDGSVSCAAPNQNQNQSAGSGRKTDRATASIVRKGKR